MDISDIDLLKGMRQLSWISDLLYSSGSRIARVVVWGGGGARNMKYIWQGLPAPPPSPPGSAPSFKPFDFMQSLNSLF